MIDPTALADIDRRIDAAVTAGDPAPLEEILAEDYIYTHSNNQHQNKREYIDAMATRTVSGRRVLSDIEVEVHDDIAITRGNLDIVYPDRPTLHMRYVRVYRSKNDRWQPISHRSVLATDRAPKA